MIHRILVLVDSSLISEQGILKGTSSGKGYEANPVIILYLEGKYWIPATRARFWIS